MEQKLAIKLRNKEICPIASRSEDNIRINAPVVVKTSRGEEFGHIVSFTKKYPQNISKEIQLRKVLRYATEQDLKNIDSLPEKESRAMAMAAEKAREFEVPIKIMAAEYLLDLQKIYIYFKVPKDNKLQDLRDYRKNLSSILKTEVTLRNLNPRDEAKFIGGLGPCGRNLCCAHWLTKPKHITVKMVKEQGFQISPTRTAGLCSRLMCCFGYEHDEPQHESREKNSGI